MTISSDLITRTAAYVKSKMLGGYTGHDWFHIERVWHMAKRLQAVEGGDLEIIEMAALLHDLGDYKQYGFNEIKGTFVLRGMMDVLDIEDELKEKMVTIIDEAQYIGEETKKPKTIEGQILQDADWLDALGAIGIARSFATGGHIKRVIYDPGVKPREKLSKAEYFYRKSEGTSVNYFYEKVLKLPRMLNTETARKIAEHRVKVVENFLEEFYKEWKGEC